MYIKIYIYSDTLRELGSYIRNFMPTAHKRTFFCTIENDLEFFPVWWLAYQLPPSKKVNGF